MIDYNLNTHILTFNLKFNCQFWDMKEKILPSYMEQQKHQLKQTIKFWIKANNNCVEYNEDDYS